MVYEDAKAQNMLIRSHITRNRIQLASIQTVCITGHSTQLNLQFYLSMMTSFAPLTLTLPGSHCCYYPNVGPTTPVSCRGTALELTGSGHI